jgi:protein-S-isoprenylcysteine O-methyltransferase Ste14
MGRVLLIRATNLYLPITAALLLAGWRRPQSRPALGMLLGFLWSLCALLLMQMANLRFGFWSYGVTGGLFRGMPVDLYLGWAVLWGILPALAFSRRSLPLVVVIMAALDVVLMPLCAPVVTLNRAWLWGEALALIVVLLPALCLARWTADAVHLSARAAILVALSGGVFLFLLPEIIFATTGSARWSSLFTQPKYLLGIELQVTALLALLGVSAVQEFAARGGGTPIPFDPPQRLVTSGIYRYVVNPMQLSCVLVLLAWGILLRSGFVAASALVGIIYGAGIAGWDERADLNGRFGERWRRYRNAVRAWRVRWKPWHDPELPLARLYVAESCGPCSEVRRWIQARNPVALAVVAAEDHPARDLARITYNPGDGTEEEEGVSAFARALEHLNFAWAFVGFILRLPVLRQTAQLLMDATGMGPQRIPRRGRVRWTLLRHM